MLFSGKKGSMRDIQVAVSFILIFAITLFMATKINTELSETAQFNESEAIEQAGAAIGVFNTAFVLIFVAMIAMTIILAYRIPTNPIFLPISLIFAAVLTYLGVMFSNIFMEIAETSAFQTVANTLPQVTILMKNLPIVVGVSCFALIIAMYVRGDNAQTLRGR